MHVTRGGVDGLEERITRWIACHAIALLRINMGIVFLWFGALKFFPGLSPAQVLAERTIGTLSFGLIRPAFSLPALAAWECLVGLGLITGRFLRLTLVLLFGHMCGTMLPLFFFPAELFTRFPFAATLEGQYIIKNLVLVSAGLVIAATGGGGALVADPDATRAARRQGEVEPTPSAPRQARA
jgi:uncharacterized membrane protein YphA (DoxX/SURF4 family)